MDMIEWDGVSPIDHETLIRDSILQYLTEEEKEKAMSISYGDLGNMLKKNHGSMFHGGTYGECIVNADTKTITVSKCDLNIKYKMTWNKAAKAIHRWVHEDVQSPAVNSETVLSDDYAEALKLDLAIKANAQIAQIHLYEVCKGLKEMRDGKLYKQLGYKNFEEYCEQEVGIKRHMAYKYTAIAEIENVESIQHFGVTKLSLLADLSEDQREEIVENIDVENTTVKELKTEIKKLTAERDETLGKYEKSEKYREELVDENNQMSEKISELIAQVDELESRPVDVTYSENSSHEVENMRKAMDKCDRDWRNKYDELQDSNIKQVQELNIKHTEELNKLKAEYEDKIKDAASDGSVGKKIVKQRSDIYIDMLYSIMDDIEDFLFEINDSSLQARHIKRFISCVQDFIDRVDYDDEEGE